VPEYAIYKIPDNVGLDIAGKTAPSHPHLPPLY